MTNEAKHTGNQGGLRSARTTPNAAAFDLTAERDRLRAECERWRELVGAFVRAYEPHTHWLGNGTALQFFVAARVLLAKNQKPSKADERIKRQMAPWTIKD